MKKRTFLKLSSMALTGTIFSPMTSCNQSPKNTEKAAEKQFNWARNLEYSTQNFHYPKTLEEVQELIRKTPNLKPQGTRHSFNTIADSTANILSLRDLNKVVSLNKEAKTVTVEAGIRYGELAEYLQKEGYALHNLASLPHISVAGACATATHGSGVKNGNLSTEVVALELVNAKGDVVQLSKDTESFWGAVVGLGGLGVVTKLTLEILPTFQVKQDVYLDLPFEQLQKHFDEIMSLGYSVSLFTSYENQRVNQVWVKTQVGDTSTGKANPDLYGAKLATRNMHPIAEISAENCTEQMGVPGPWHERLPHFKMNFTPSSGQELQAEYFVPRKNAVEALTAMYEMGEQITPHLLISEIRTIAADRFWMSPCYQQDCVAIHFTWKQDWPNVSKVLPVIEEKLAPYQARPHWAKLFTMTPERLQSLYTKLPDYQRLAHQHDPEGKFVNEFLKKNVFGEGV